MTGCTYGKGNLIHRDFGKNAFTFSRRSDGRSVRVVTRPDAFGPRDPQSDELSQRARGDAGSDEDRRAFKALQARRTEVILAASLETLFTIQPVGGPLPRKARIHRSIQCAACGEQAMETRVRQFGGQTLCLPCFEQQETVR